MRIDLGFKRIATEEAFATKDLIRAYRELLARKGSSDIGFNSLMGYYLENPSERTRAVSERLQNLGSRRLGDMDATGIDCWAGFESPTAVEGLELVDLPEIAEAVAVQHFGGPAGIPDAWQAVFAWLDANGAIPSAPGREVYLSSDPGDEDAWVTEVQQPFVRR